MLCNHCNQSFVVRTYNHPNHPYLNAESKNQIAAGVVLKIILAIYKVVKIIA